MFSTANAALWAESTAALEEDVSEDAYRLVRKPAKKGSSSEVGGGGARGERGKEDFGIVENRGMSSSPEATFALVAVSRQHQALQGGLGGLGGAALFGCRFSTPFKSNVDAPAFTSIPCVTDDDSILASYPPLLEGEPESSRLARAAAGDALSARLAKRLDAALAAADGPSFEAVASFVLAAGAPRPAPPPGRPPPSARLPAALAVAGGVNPVDHCRTISRLACDLRFRGCLVVELAPRDLLDGGRRGAGGALLAASRQLIGAGAEADDVAGIRAWYEQEVVPVATMRGGSFVAARASPPSAAAAPSTAKALPEEARKKRKGRTAAARDLEEGGEAAEVPAAAVVDDPTAAAAAAATFAAATATAMATAAAATTTAAAAAAAAPSSAPPSCSSRRPALSVPTGTPPPIVFVIEAVEASDPAVLGDLLRLLQHAFSFDRLPIVAVLGVATSAVMAEAALPPAARRALSPARFRLARTATRAEVALGAALGGGAFPGILLHHHAAASVDARFMDVDFTAADLGRVLEAHVGAHALRTPGVALAAALAASGGGTGGAGGGAQGKEKKSVSFSSSEAEEPSSSSSRLGRLEKLIEGTAEPLQKHFAALAGFDDELDEKEKNTSNKRWASEAASELDRLRSCWSGWAASLRWVSSAARALGFKAAADGYSLRELLRDGGAPSFMTRGQPGFVAVAALKDRALRATPQAVRAALAALQPAVAAVEGAKELFAEELKRASELIRALDGNSDDGGEREDRGEQQQKTRKTAEEKGSDADGAKAPAAAALAAAPSSDPLPLPLSRSLAGRRNALAAATAIAAAAADAAAHPSAAGAAALISAVAERFLSTPPHALPSAAPCLVRGGKALMASLAGAPRAALHMALTEPDAYLGPKRANGNGGEENNESINNPLLGDDDAVLLYRSLLMCDETVDIRELLVRFAVYYGHAGVREEDDGHDADGKRKKQKRKKIGHAGAQTTADGLVAPSVQNRNLHNQQNQNQTSLSLFQASVPQPVLNFRERRRQAPASEVCARFQAALLELQLAGVVARGRKRGCVRRAIFPPASACV